MQIIETEVELNKILRNMEIKNRDVLVKTGKCPSKVELFFHEQSQLGRYKLLCLTVTEISTPSLTLYTNHTKIPIYN